MPITHGAIASRADGINISIVLLSTTVRAVRFLSANEQIINFFILLSADGSGRGTLNSRGKNNRWRTTGKHRIL